MTADPRARILRLESEISRKTDELAQLRAELHDLKTQGTNVNRHSAPAAKIELYRSLFIGRDDAYALRWTSSRTGKSGWSPAVRGGFYSDATTDADLLPLRTEALEWHLTGCSPQGRDFHAGLYPLLLDDSCRLLACDFDGGTWREDAAAYARACGEHGVPVSLEISRSGDGAHAWIFFEEAVPAASARRLGSMLLQAAMSFSGALGPSSYDRFFPAQDLLPLRASGRMRFGNLIALPLQGSCRKRGTTVFADPDGWHPFDDQFAYLSTVSRVSTAQLTELLRRLTPVTAGPEHTVHAASARPLLTAVAPDELQLTLGASIELPLAALPSNVLAKLKHVASVPNPEFFRKQAQRFSTFGTPRHIISYEQDAESLRLPRGLLDQTRDVLAGAGINANVALTFPTPAKREELKFHGTLRPDQQQAVSSLLQHDTGVLVAPPGAGKTVMACSVIGSRQVPTAVIVNRAELINQWRARLSEFLGIDDKFIGQLGNGRRKRKGLIDIIMLQSISHRTANPTLLSEYGQIIIDECHAVAAPAAEAAIRQVATRYWLGLTATPYRADQLDELITMQCGPIRAQLTTETSVQQHLHVHETRFTTDEPGHDGASIQTMYGELARDRERNHQIAQAVRTAYEAGRRCLVLTTRLEHLEELASLLAPHASELLILHGRLSKQERSAVLDRVNTSGATPTVLLAIDKVAGEGLDLHGLDTLFLTMPISFKGRIVQQLGRIGRTESGAQAVQVYDFHDSLVPLFDRMHRKRRRVMSGLGWKIT